MQTESVFTAFENGSLVTPGETKEFSPLPWNPHPKFRGVALKHLVTGADSNGLFSYHLVRIDPGEQIGLHIHDPQLETHEVIAGRGTCRTDEGELRYRPGAIAIFPSGVRHEITADETGLLLFAKFIPPLC